MRQTLRTALLFTTALITPPASDDSFVLGQNWFYWGQSSQRGGIADATYAPLQLDRAKVEAGLADPSFVTASETTPTGTTAPKYTIGSGKIFHNWGVGGTNYTQVETAANAQKGAMVSGDGVCFHQGDNGVSVGTVNGYDLLYQTYVNTYTNLSLASRPFYVCVNTRGGLNQNNSTNPEIPGTFWATTKELLFRKLDANALFKGHVVDFFHCLREFAPLYGLIDANDQADIDKGYSPRNFMLQDGSHMGDRGYTVIATYADYRIKEAYNGGRPCILRQFVTADFPASPAAGDAIGQIVQIGSGGTVSLDPTNTQASYSVDADGTVRRIGTTLPVRDLEPLIPRISKTNKTSRREHTVWVGEFAPAGSTGVVELDGYGFLTCANGSRLSNTNIGTIIYRFGGATGDNNQPRVVAGTGTGGWTFTRNNVNNLDIVMRNAGGTVIVSHTTTGGLFSDTTLRWVAISWDLSNPAARKVLIVHWADPTAATVSYDPANVNGGGAVGTFPAGMLASDTTTAHVVRLNLSFGIGEIGTGINISNLGTRRGPGRWADLAFFNAYWNFTQTTERQKFSGAPSSGKATRSAAWLANDNVDSNVPTFILDGYAANWRQGKTRGSAAQELAYSAFKNPTTGVDGYIKNAA